MSTMLVGENTNRFYESVEQFCLDKLVDAHNPSTGLFDRQLRNAEWDSVEGTEAMTSTAICLIGLHRAKVDPSKIRMDLARTFEELVESVQTLSYPHGFGLIVWANAVWDFFTFSQLLTKSGLDLERLKAQLSAMTTMEVAWLLSGLAHEALRSNDEAIGQLYESIQHELKSRYDARACVFRHAASGAAIADRVRASVANFADQIYSVQALAFTAIVDQGTDNLQIAQSCASKLIELQGNLGQWWWHYDARDGEVAQYAPVYSVHQHAMGPMALMALSIASNDDFSETIELSHNWISANENGHSMLDHHAGTLWRDIDDDLSSLQRLTTQMGSIIGIKKDRKVRDLILNKETRPYEWAWCLYAAAIAKKTCSPGHIT